MITRAIPQLRHISQLELGWIVGFLEGEGTFGCNGQHSIVISASQLQREPIERLVAYTGLGRVRGPYQRSYIKGPGYHQWAVSGPKAVAIINLIRSHMSPRRQAQIDAAMAKYESRPRADYRAARRKSAVTLRARRHNNPAQLKIIEGRDG